MIYFGWYALAVLHDYVWRSCLVLDLEQICLRLGVRLVVAFVVFEALVEVDTLVVVSRLNSSLFTFTYPALTRVVETVVESS